MFQSGIIFYNCSRYIARALFSIGPIYLLLGCPAQSHAVDERAPYIQLLLQQAGNERLDRLYRSSGFTPLWHGPSQSQARTALLTEIARRPYYGLPPDNACTLRVNPDAAPLNQQAAADVDMTVCFLRLWTETATGAVAKESLGRDWFLDGDARDFTDADLTDIRRGRIHELLARASPASPQYEALQKALMYYTNIAANGGWPSVDSASEIVLDGTDARASTVSKRLGIEGYPLSDGLDLSSLKRAVRTFQADNGLLVDGRVGKQTIAALNISAHSRIAQIAVNMERWRHVPHSFGSSYIVVNVADASLTVVQDAAETIYMRAIVGDVKHPTPAFRAVVSAITLNPSWTIPRSIATREILPKLKRNPKYLLENEIEILSRDPDPSGLNVDWRRISPVHFGFQLRQKPGPKNPLGLIKFEMANPFDVYIHDTPAKALFAHPRRGLSHGCIRVEQPETLALRLLPSQTSESLGALIAKGATDRLPLDPPLPVYVLYWTAFADESGRINFRDDIYNRDGAVAVALKYEGGTPASASKHLLANDNCISSS